MTECDEYVLLWNGNFIEYAEVDALFWSTTCGIYAYWHAQSSRLVYLGDLLSFLHRGLVQIDCLIVPLLYCSLGEHARGVE